MVLAELTGRVTKRLEHLGDRRILRLQADIGTRHTHLGQARADRVLSRDKGCAPRRAALLPVIVSEGYALGRDAVDVRCPVAHLPAAVEADVPPADVIAKENQDVRLLVGQDSALPQWLNFDCAPTGRDRDPVASLTLLVTTKLLLRRMAQGCIPNDHAGVAEAAFRLSASLPPRYGEAIAAQVDASRFRREQFLAASGWHAAIVACATAQGITPDG